MGQAEEEKIFAVGDIHGSHHRLLSLLKRMPIEKDRDTLVFLGDYINRGPDSKKVLDTLIEIQKTYNKSIFLKGNHEQALLSYANSGDVDIVPFLRAMGVEATAESYGARVRNLRDLACFPQDHQDFLRNLAFCHVAGKYIFTHADISDSMLRAMIQGKPVSYPDSIEERKLLSSRRLVQQDFDSAGVSVVFGHSPFETPLVLSNRICIDTGAAYGNFLTAVELPSQQFIHA